MVTESRGILIYHLNVASMKFIERNLKFRESDDPIIVISVFNSHKKRLFVFVFVIHICLGVSEYGGT